MGATRRNVMLGAGAAFAVALGGGYVMLNREEAEVRGAAFAGLDDTEQAILAGLGSALVPRAAEFGLVDFLDHHLALEPAKSLAAIRYLDIAPPYADFYRICLAQIHKGILAGAIVPDVGSPRWDEVISFLAGGADDKWQGPPAPLFLFVLKLDAMDVAYGTPEGFERLGVDYMPHIEPEAAW